MYENKKMKYTNFEYFMEHAEEIINDTEHILGPFVIPSKYDAWIYEKEYPGIRDYINRYWEKHENERMMFGSSSSMLSREEYVKWTDEVKRKYCEDTGRWDLFIWE